MISEQDFRARAIQFMDQRKWQRFVAKRKQFQQNLFDHSLLALDILIILTRELKEALALTDAEIVSARSGAVLHDCAKKTDEFQLYIKDNSKPKALDTNKIVAEETVVAFIQELGEPDLCAEDILTNILLHMRAERTPANLLIRLISAQHQNKRWSLIADLVRLADNLASAYTLLDAKHILERSFLAPHLHVNYHSLEKTSSLLASILHQVADNAYQAHGWTPLLRYNDGALYVFASNRGIPMVPTIVEIEQEAVSYFSQLFSSIDFTEYVVGESLLRTFFYSEFFDYRSIPQYLTKASTRVGRKSFIQRPLKSKTSGKEGMNRTEAVEQYLALKGAAEKALPETIELHSQRISNAYPEMAVFRLFKEMMNTEILGKVLTDEAQSVYATKINKPSPTPDDVLEYEYDRIFGQGAYQDLRGMSVLAPAKDMALRVDYFWALNPKDLGCNSDVAKVEYMLDHNKRVGLLIGVLGDVAATVFSCIPAEQRSQWTNDSLYRDMASVCMDIFVHPNPQKDVLALAQMQLAIYQESASNLYSKDQPHLCPACGRPVISDGFALTATHTSKASAYSNHYHAHGKYGSGGHVVVCVRCKLERYLHQLFLPNGALVIQKGHVSSPMEELFMKRTVRDMFTLALPILYQTKHDLLLYLRKFDHWMNETVPSQQWTVEENRDLRKAILSLYAMEQWDMDALNSYWGTAYESEATALEAIAKGAVEDDDLLSLHGKYVCASSHQLMLGLTANQVIVPLPSITKTDFSSLNSFAFKLLYLSFILAKRLYAAVQIIDNPNVYHFASYTGINGAVHVPNVANLRIMINRLINAYNENIGSHVKVYIDEWIPSDYIPVLSEAFLAVLVFSSRDGRSERNDLLRIPMTERLQDLRRMLRIYQDPAEGSEEYAHWQALKRVMRKH